MSSTDSSVGTTTIRFGATRYGPDDWQRVDPTNPDPEVRPVPSAEVSDIEVGTDHISFDVDRVGTPVLVKASYFPNWQASGADGPYRVAPNLMVVVPTGEHVELTYGRQPVEWLGYALTLLGIALAIYLAARPPLRGLSPEPAPLDPDAPVPGDEWRPPADGSTSDPDPPPHPPLPPQHFAPPP